MSEQKEGKRMEVSRRKFLRNAGLFIGGAASLSIGSIALAGYVTNPNCQAASSQPDTEYVGECVCPDCSTVIPHPKGVPCRTINCPKCGVYMTRGTS